MEIKSQYMHSSTLFSEIELNELKEVAILAGQEIMKIYHTSFDIETKMDGSPVTLADSISNHLITEMLRTKFKYPILSEENDEISYEIRKNWERFWLIDPLDGTKEFIKKRREFTVNIALIEHGRPIFGVIYAPVFEELFWAEKGQGSYFTFKNSTTKLETSKKIRLENSKLENPEGKNLKLIVSKSHCGVLNLNQFFEKERKFDIQTIFMGSSLKFCRLAQSKIDCYIRMKPTMEWDTAAGQIIAEESNCNVFNYNTSLPLVYNKENLLNPYFISL